MPSTNKTTYGLNRWTEADVPVMDDFNADNQIIDQKLSDLNGQADATQATLSVLDGKKANKADIPSRAEVNAMLASKSFTIATGAWAASSEVAGFPFAATISVAGLTAADDAMVFFNLASVQVAQSVGICSGMGKTVAGGIIVYTRAKPTTALSGTYTVYKGGA